ncbi:TetR/AcrR family transcriptional regulator [Acidaminobacter sp. JC074]|uniref:TetR/AcrR family transcriptional regulator n=1 Tax=Acidaminobacter sp. JC074 TaxID=2530199 RepID=UPI001F0F4914|nr:TetR/AcrR family transcriptional regulator [Acidaminobacter sp. JC074]MCH4888080.1 TetR/AcrR family transcriptional regulator [Acidaminobacter sp. JC074]
MYHLSSNKKTHQSAELIYNGLCELISEKDYSAITIKELVERAGVGRATFYRLFDSINDVLKYKCDMSFDLLRQSVTQYRISQRLSEPTASTKLLKPILRFWYLDSIIIEVIIKANALDILLSNIEKLFDDLFHSLDKKVNPDFHEDYFVAIRTGILFNILIKWVKNGKNIPPDQLTDILLKQMQEVKNVNLLF